MFLLNFIKNLVRLCLPVYAESNRYYKVGVCMLIGLSDCRQNDVMRSSSTVEDDYSPTASADVRRLCCTMAVRTLVVPVHHHRRPHRPVDAQVSMLYRPP